MKKFSILFFIGLITVGTSCKKYLDINTNPNAATSATSESLLPQALTGTANNVNGYNSYGSQLAGYMANAGGFGGFGTSITYSFSSNDFSGRWSTTYDNLEDYQAIIDQTDGQLPQYSYFNAAARIMKAYNFQLLVDAYNDVPYSQALKGQAYLTAKYDNAADIYDSLATELDKAIATINNADTITGVNVIDLSSSDVLFGSDMTLWKQFANTIKLRLIVRGNGKVNFQNTSFDEAGFLETEALVNPGFRLDVGRQNPQWESWAFTSTGGAGNKAWMPNVYVFGFYDGTKLTDPARGSAMYYKYPSTGTNRLGIESNNLQSSPTGSFWYPGTDRNPSTAGDDNTGVLKGPDAGYPLFTASESYFLQSEAVVRGLLATGDAKALFDDGINASFNYLYQNASGELVKDPTDDEATYRANNKGSYLVNYDLATSTDQKIEAIITQKYIALNFIAGHEAWNEYRRTHYPRVISSDASGYFTFASTVSESTQPDKLPTRILYPTTEGSYNSANVPRNISPFSSFIFWAIQ